MDFEIIDTKNYTLITVLNDRLDTNNAPDLKSECVKVNAEGECNIILDVSNCTYCDSSGLSAILVANRLCEDKLGTFISMLHTVLVITRTLGEADEFLKEKENL